MADKSVDDAINRALKGADRYFMGTHEVHKTADRIEKLLKEAGIDYAVAGALALNAHGVERMTEDVDLLVTREGLTRFKELWLGRGYIEVTPGAKPIRDAETRVKIDFLVSGDFPGDGLPKPVAFPIPKDVAHGSGRWTVVNLPTLIELKLASGMTAKDRPRDFDDVIRLIRERQLPRSFGDQLNEYVRGKWAELWQIADAPPSGDY